MAELAVIGTSEFTMGFALIGIKKIMHGETGPELARHFEEALQDDNIGIIVTNDAALDTLDKKMRRQVEDSVMPVVVALSTTSGAQENLREKIKQAIGVDLWSK